MTDAAADTKRPQVDTLLADVFKLMEFPAKLEFKDLADGSLGVAVHFDGEVPGGAAGKRSAVVDSVQFWVNKVVNRPNVPRRWVNLGVNAFPEPRPPQGEKPERAPKAEASAAPAPAPAKKDAPKKDAAPAKEKAAPPPQHGKKVDERTLKPAADPLMTAAGKLLAEKSAKLGRVYAVMGLTNEQRALLLQAADAVTAQRAKAEGEGHWRRVTFTPEKLTVIPRKQVMPDYDDEDEDE